MVLQRTSDGGRGGWNAWREAAREGAGPSFLIAGLLIATFVAEWITGGPAHWGLSGQALIEGRWQTLGLHMLAHASLAHIWMNITGLLSLGPYVSLNLGTGMRRWLATGLLFLTAGLAGAVAYLAVNPTGAIPMVGASGAICGLWGAAARFDSEGRIAPLVSRRVGREVRNFVLMNLVLFALLFGLVRLSGGQGGLAWESHVGGFVLGLMMAPRLRARSTEV